MKGKMKCRCCKGTTYVHATKTPIHVQTDDCTWELDVTPFGPHWSQVGWAEKADAPEQAGAPGSVPGLGSALNPFGTDDHAEAAKARVAVDLGQMAPMPPAASQVSEQSAVDIMNNKHRTKLVGLDLEDDSLSEWLGEKPPPR